MTTPPIRETYALLFSAAPEVIADWASATLGLAELWRAPGDDGTIEHVELAWGTGRISINIASEASETSRTGATGPTGIALRIDDRDEVDRLHARALAAASDHVGALQETRVAYSFTATDPDGNQWWVNAESGFLDQLRNAD